MRSPLQHRSAEKNDHANRKHDCLREIRGPGYDTKRDGELPLSRSCGRHAAENSQREEKKPCKEDVGSDVAESDCAEGAVCEERICEQGRGAPVIQPTRSGCSIERIAQRIDEITEREDCKGKEDETDKVNECELALRRGIED